MRTIFDLLVMAALCVVVWPALAQPGTPPPPTGVVVEAEDFRPTLAPGGQGWKTVVNGQGNYMVDIIGFQHISGERLLSAPATAKDAKAEATVVIPEDGDYRLWSRFEQPTNTENRFRVEVRQNGQLVGGALMGEKDAPKYFFGASTPIGQADPSWGSEGLVEQAFDLKGLRAGPAQITLIAVEQPVSTPTALAANRNVDFLFLTRDLTDTWRSNPVYAAQYRILDAALQAMPTRYFIRLTAPRDTNIGLRWYMNRIPWYRFEEPAKVELKANIPGEWIALRNQDVTHFSTLAIQNTTPVAAGQKPAGLQVKVEVATAPDSAKLLRTFDWNDANSPDFLVAFPPYPNRTSPNGNRDERVMSVEEQYSNILAYLREHPSKVGKEPTKALGWAITLPMFERGRIGTVAADLGNEIGFRYFGGTAPPNTEAFTNLLESSRALFARRGWQPSKSMAVIAYRQPPTAANIAKAKKAVDESGAAPYIERFDYGDEIHFAEWLGDVTDEQIKTAFADWQMKHKGKAEFEKPDSSAIAAKANPVLYVDSQRFYEEFAIDHVATMAKQLPAAFGPDIFYGANYSAHPAYYPLVSMYINWFRRGASNFGRHSEYFWQVGQPGPLINSYIADWFTSGMRDNPKAVLQQYTMPHSPGNTDRSFRRTGYSHLAHGARRLDYFGTGVNHSFTENYIDFRDPERYAAIRDLNRSMGLIEDILPDSRPVPSRVAMIISESTERWDLAAIALDRANFSPFGDNYKEARLAYHLDRVGIYYALIHNSRPPDMLTEEDVQNGRLKEYDVAYWVGDCAEAATVGSLNGWVQNGGHLVATAGGLHFDQYKKPLPAGLNLLGLQSAALDERQPFFRAQIEMPKLQPLDTIGTMPVLGILDRVQLLPAARATANFAGGQPAVIEQALGRGRTTYIAALPGVAYLWRAYQPGQGEAPMIPSRGPSSHKELTNFDKAAGDFIAAQARPVFSNVTAEGALIDARLIRSPQGYAVPLANYSVDVDKPIDLTIRGIDNITKITSANAGPLKWKRTDDGTITLRYQPGIGDVLRIDNR